MHPLPRRHGAPHFTSATAVLRLRCGDTATPYGPFKQPAAAVQNKMAVNDWTSIQTVFDKLQKQLEKTMKSAILATAPRQYVRMLCELDDFLSQTMQNRDMKKKMSPTNAKAFNTTKQRLRKLLPEFEGAMARWREHPVATEDEGATEGSEEGSGEEGARRAAACLLRTRLLQGVWGLAGFLLARQAQLSARSRLRLLFQQREAAEAELCPVSSKLTLAVHICSTLTAVCMTGLHLQITQTGPGACACRLLWPKLHLLFQQQSTSLCYMGRMCSPLHGKPARALWPQRQVRGELGIEF
jgi:Eukaryotic translation initiation factor 3 subunit 8 N-terminus